MDSGAASLFIPLCIYCTYSLLRVFSLSLSLILSLCWLFFLLENCSCYLRWSIFSSPKRIASLFTFIIIDCQERTFSRLYPKCIWWPIFMDSQTWPDARCRLKLQPQLEDNYIVIITRRQICVAGRRAG